MKAETLVSLPVEIREGQDKQPQIVGTIIQEGRAGSIRRELFTPGSVLWPFEGVGILVGHGGPLAGTVQPTREKNGEIRFSAPASPQMVKAVEGGRKGLSVEFVALAESRTAGGIREVRRAFVGAAALVTSAEYTQAKAEIRDQKPVQVFLL